MPKQRVALKGNYLALHPSPPYKTFLRLWNKHFLTETYKHIQTFAFQVLGESSSWASRHGTVQMFSDINQKHVYWRKVSKVFSCIFFTMFSELNLRTWVRFFELNCIVT